MGRTVWVWYCGNPTGVAMTSLHGTVNYCMRCQPTVPCRRRPALVGRGCCPSRFGVRGDKRTHAVHLTLGAVARGVQLCPRNGPDRLRTTIAGAASVRAVREVRKGGGLGRVVGGMCGRKGGARCRR